MQLLNHSLQFEALPGALAAYRATADEARLLSFASSVRQSGGRFVALWGSDERDRSAGFAIHVAFGIAEGLAIV
ncbi:MAG: hypothetical protein WC681_20345, partial [Sterolibacterium sp.]